jgi:hypothetical protein
MESLLNFEDVQRLQMLASLLKEKLAEYDVAHRLLSRVLALEHLSEMATTYTDIGLNSVKRAIMTGHWSGSEKLKQLKSQPLVQRLAKDLGSQRKCSADLSCALEIRLEGSNHRYLINFVNLFHLDPSTKAVMHIF